MVQVREQFGRHYNAGDRRHVCIVAGTDLVFAVLGTRLKWNSGRN